MIPDISKTYFCINNSENSSLINIYEVTVKSISLKKDNGKVIAHCKIKGVNRHIDVSYPNDDKSHYHLCKSLKEVNTVIEKLLKC